MPRNLEDTVPRWDDEETVVLAEHDRVVWLAEDFLLFCCDVDVGEYLTSRGSDSSQINKFARPRPRGKDGQVGRYSLAWDGLHSAYAAVVGEDEAFHFCGAEFDAACGFDLLAHVLDAIFGVGPAGCPVDLEGA